MKLKKNLLDKIRRIERESYPVDYQMLQEVNSYKDLLEYCQTPIVRIYTYDWSYMIIGIHPIDRYVEVVDFAKLPHSKIDLFFYLNKIEKWVKRGFSVVMDCRESTSYRLLETILRRRKDLNLTNSEPYWWGDERFYSVRIEPK